MPLAAGFLRRECMVNLLSRKELRVSAWICLSYPCWELTLGLWEPPVPNIWPGRHDRRCSWSFMLFYYAFPLDILNASNSKLIGQSQWSVWQLSQGLQLLNQLSAHGIWTVHSCRESAYYSRQSFCLIP